MAVSTRTVSTHDPAGRWLAAAFVTAVVMTLAIIPLQTAAEFRESGMLIGMATYAGGVLFEFASSFVLIAVFAAILSATSLRDYTDRALPTVALALAFGVVVWAVYFGVIWAYWARAVGMMDVPFPFFDLEFLALNLVIWAVIGAVYWFTLRWFRGRAVVTDETATKSTG